MDFHLWNWSIGLIRFQDAKKYGQLEKRELFIYVTHLSFMLRRIIMDKRPSSWRNRLCF